MTEDRRAALVEMMARAMEKADSHAYEYQQTSSWEHLAEVALDLALEEAAREMLTRRERWWPDEACAAIRALKSRPTLTMD